MTEATASKWPSVSRILAGVLVFQLGLGLLLVIGDMAGAGLSLPSFGPNQPQLTEPVSPATSAALLTLTARVPQTPPTRCRDG